MTKNDMSNKRFLAMVKDKAQEVREIYRRNWLPLALARRKRFIPMNFTDAVKTVLLEIVRHDGSGAANRPRAADILLAGKDRHWSIHPSDERDARALVAACYKRKAPVPQPIQPKIKARTKDNYDTKRDLAIARECAVLEYAMKHGSNEEKLDAIHAWFVAMEYLAPEQLKACEARAAKEMANDRS